ncbi:hypothetical protein D3C75_982770 [compost metagenome]
MSRQFLEQTAEMETAEPCQSCQIFYENRLLVMGVNMAQHRCEAFNGLNAPGLFGLRQLGYAMSAQQQRKQPVQLSLDRQLIAEFTAFKLTDNG